MADGKTIENRYREFESGAELPSVESLSAPDLPEESYAEELSALAGAPAASVAAIMVLDAIRSPFLVGDGGQVGLQDITLAMYVITHPREAARLAGSHVVHARAERAFNATAKTPEHLDVFLRRIGGMDPLTAAAMEWVDGLPEFSPAKASEDIGSMLALAMSGWKMIPSRGESEKKTPA